MTCHDYRDYLKMGCTIKSCLEESTVTGCSDTSNFLQCDKPLIKAGPTKFIFDKLHYSKTITIVHPAVFVALHGYTRLKMSDSLLSLFSFNIQIICGSIKQKKNPLAPQFGVKVPIHTTITEQVNSSKITLTM